MGIKQYTSHYFVLKRTLLIRGLAGLAGHKVIIHVNYYDLVEGHGDICGWVLCGTVAMLEDSCYLRFDTPWPPSKI